MQVSVSLPMLATVTLLLACGGGAAAWAMRMGSLAEQIQAKRKALKTMHLAGRVPPNQQVMDYLASRGSALEGRYREALALMTVSPAGLEGRSDPQLYFQQRVHEVQNALARLASARDLAAPLVLGLPKDLPPPDVAPRFLIQLAMVQEVAEVIIPIPQISELASFKVEDPQPVAAAEERDAFLTRLPIRVRGRATLKGVATLLAMLDRIKPVVDVVSLRLSAPKAAAEPAAAAAGGAAEPAAEAAPVDVLEFDCVAVRYLVTTPQLPSSDEPAPSGAGGKRR
jgi:hypothetical protein